MSATPIKNTVNDFVPLYEFLIKKTIDPDSIIEGKSDKKISNVRITDNKSKIEEIKKNINNKISYYYITESNLFFPDTKFCG